jgi:hypothetical protein
MPGGRFRFFADRAHAQLFARGRLPRPPPLPTQARPIAQLRPMRMLWFVPLVLVDLPVDVVVVLEQQKRAGEASRIERALHNG